jgi:Protein of unknown function (DUF3551)
MYRLTYPLTFVALMSIAAGLSTPAVGKTRHRPPPASISGIQDRYCLQGKIWGYPGNCLFSTYGQCMATASGTYAYCALNPTYAFREWPGYR